MKKHVLLYLSILGFSPVFAMEDPKGTPPCDLTARPLFLAHQLRHQETADTEVKRAAFLKIIESNAGDFDRARAHQGLAKTYSVCEPNKALEILNTAIKLAPTYPDFYFTAGDIAGFANKNSILAVDYYTRGLTHCVKGKGNYWKTVIYYSSLGKVHGKLMPHFAKAKAVYQEAVEFVNANPSLIKDARVQRVKFTRLIGAMCIKLGEYAQAIPYFQKALDESDSSDFREKTSLYADWAYTLFLMKKNDEAQGIYESGLDYIRKTDLNKVYDTTQLPIFFDRYAQFLVQINRKEEAQKIFQEGITLSQQAYSYEKSQLYLHYGQLLEEDQKLDLAKEAYQHGLAHAEKQKPKYCSELKAKIENIVRQQKKIEKAPRSYCTIL